MPLNWRSSRTICVKREAWGLAESARGTKSAMAMRGLLASMPIAVRNQSWADADLPDKARRVRNRNVRKPLSFECTLTSESIEKPKLKLTPLTYGRRIEIQSGHYIAAGIVGGQFCYRIRAHHCPN